MKKIDLKSYGILDIHGQELRNSFWDAKAFLILNVASKCGFTPQYSGFESIYRTYQPLGLEIIGFPCNQFGRQEPKADHEIAEFCKLNYDVTFPVAAKCEVNGKNTHPLWKDLKAKAPGAFGTQSIKWNFTKFLLSHSGEKLERFGPQTKPEQILNAIHLALDLKRS